MRTWLAKFRISAALDRARARGRNTCSGTSECEEVNRFAASVQSLDRQLRGAELPPAPTGLHASVMRAVRVAGQSHEPRAASSMLWWLPASAVALIAALVLWQPGSRRSAESDTLAVATAALEQSQELSQKAPSVALGPLSEEMNLLNQDLRNTIEFLMASVP